MYVQFLSSELTTLIMATRVRTVRVEVIQIAVFLDSEHQDCYASITNCLGETTQLEKPYPTLDLEKGDFLLTIDNQDIRHKSKESILKLIEDVFSQDKELLKFSYIEAKEFDAETHLYSDRPPASTRFWGYCTRCEPPEWYSYTRKPDYNFRTHEHVHRSPTQDVSNIKMSTVLEIAGRLEIPMRFIFNA